MRLNLAVLLFVQLTSSMLSANRNAAESLEPVKGERTSQKDVNPPVDQKAATSEPRDVSLGSTTVGVQQDASSETRIYTVWASDVHNKAQVNETRTWLKGLVKDKDKMRDELGWNWETVEDLPADEFDKLYDEGRLDEELDNFEVVRAWSGVTLDQAKYEKVAAKTEWVKAILPRKHISDMIAVPKFRTKTTRALETRKFEWGNWKKQEGAARDLASASWYKGSHFDDMKDYVYEDRTGKGVHVYVMDQGVEVDVKNEAGEKVFPGFDDEGDDSGILETRAFRDQSAPHNIREDHSSSGHGTKVASKVVGQWGTAKEATLVPVQFLQEDRFDFVQGLRQIIRHIIRHHRRPDSNAVAVVSKGLDLELPSGLTEGYTREEAANDQDGKDIKFELDNLFRYGVPVVFPSGNEGDKGRQAIDHLPQILETDDFPMINVGAATPEGKAASFSQGQGSQDGTQLTIYGVGVAVEVHDDVDGRATRDSGTSLAAPAVAGIIAVHMNYEPWDKSKKGLDRVKEIKRWITTPESSWQRAADPDKQVNMIWNGADKAAHDSVSNNQSPNPSPQPQKRTLAVGLEQTTTPECSNTISNLDLPPFITCKSKHESRYFFYRHDDNNQEPDSLCTSLLNDFHQDDQGATTDENLFEHPTWPAGEWTLNLFGEEYVYRNDGHSPGALFKGEQQISCSGDLENHDPLSNELCEDSLTKEEGRKRKRRRLVGCTW